MIFFLWMHRVEFLIIMGLLLLYSIIGISILFFAIGVVSALDAVYRVVFLIFVFLGGAFLFLIMDFYFLG
jgi:NADH:ubiquinone oxidoreductase subunit 6 (subunit J)